LCQLQFTIPRFTNTFYRSLQQWPNLNRSNMHEAYIYHPFSTGLDGQIHTKMTTNIPQIVASLNLLVLGLNRVNIKPISMESMNLYNPNKQCSQPYKLGLHGNCFTSVSSLAWWWRQYVPPKHRLSFDDYPVLYLTKQNYQHGHLTKVLRGQVNWCTNYSFGDRPIFCSFTAIIVRIVVLLNAGTQILAPWNKQPLDSVLRQMSPNHSIRSILILDCNLSLSLARGKLLNTPKHATLFHSILHLQTSVYISDS
jgi:hypothetical protein